MKSANKLVSVIIPTYNCEKYIEECIKSICMQTYKELEIIVVDDKSTDSTVKIIESIMDDRICLIQKNQEVVSVNREILLWRKQKEDI